MSEVFASAGLVKEAGQSPAVSENDGGDGNSTFTVSTTTGERPHSASSMPSPIIASEDFDLDMKPCLDDSCFSDSCCQQASSSDDMSMSRLDDLLRSNSPQEFVAESGLACVDDLFPSFSTGHDFSLLDGMSTWPAESLQGFEPLSFLEEEIMQSDSTRYGREEESVSQMFTQWLRSNAHWISFSDLLKIKLKTSTIETATSRLGGGTQGLMLFLKFVLMWVQSNQVKHATLEEAIPAAGVSSSAMQFRSSLASEFLGTSEVAMEAVPTRDDLSAFESSCVVEGAGVHANHLSGLSSTLSHIAAAPSCPHWITGAQRTQTPPVEVRTTVREISPSSVSPPSLRSPANGGNGRIGAEAIGDAASMMMLMQQQNCTDATPAATTRAARKSRMERQRWSVRRNSKWSTSHAHQSQHRLAAPTLSGGAQTNLLAWSQVLESSPHNLPYSSSKRCRLRQGGRSTTETQQSKKTERNLRLLFYKELKQSDVGNLGRIILPKAVETCLPPLELRDGVNLVVEDMNSSKVWNMRYRFWPNNKSRMYLLENTSGFVKSYDLKEGDYMILFFDNITSRFVIRGAKGAVFSGTSGIEDVSDVPVVCNGGKKRISLPKDEADLVLMGAMNSEESCDDSLFAELIEQSLKDLKESSETQMLDPLIPI